MGGSAYNQQFMSHAGPRGPPGMSQGGMGPGQSRAPPSMGQMYGPGGPAQRMAQHPNYGPGPQQGPLRPQQGLKRPYNSEVSGPRGPTPEKPPSVFSSIHKQLMGFLNNSY